MQDTTHLSRQSIENILKKIEEEGHVECELPGDGFLHMDAVLPFLMVYRKKEGDIGSRRLAKSAGSYLIIGTEEFENYRELLFKLVEKQSAEFITFLILEIYTGAQGSRKFVIKGPAHKVPTTLDELKKELLSDCDRKLGMQLEAGIEQTKERQAEGVQPLLDVESAKACGGLLVSLEVPPVYRNEQGELYPTFFRQFRDYFAEAVQKAVFDFLRVQTSSGINSYNALGKRKIHEEVYKIDRELTEIENTYQFLLLVAPVNIQQIRKEFFESNFTNVLDYHYRLLTVDPDLLKRRLYNLRIDEIDDPALCYIFKEKREELDQQITMLNEMGTRNFFYNSIRLYRGVENPLKNEALKILEELPEDLEEESENLIDAKEFEKLALEEFDYFRSQDPEFACKVYLRPDLNVMMVSRGELYVPSDYVVDRTEAKALIQHEVGTHALTFYNGKKQPLTQLAAGLADYDPLQEGISVFSEYLVGCLTVNRLRILAGRVIAGAALMEGKDFKGIFDLLYRQHGFFKERAFNITSRIMQGGGFLKDIIYLQGMVEVRDYLRNGGDLNCLLAGKFALKHLPVINDLTEREILKPPTLLPRYMELEDYEKRIKKIREGLPLFKMTER